MTLSSSQKYVHFLKQAREQLLETVRNKILPAKIGFSSLHALTCVIRLRVLYHFHRSMYINLLKQIGQQLVTTVENSQPFSPTFQYGCEYFIIFTEVCKFVKTNWTTISSHR